MASSISVKGQAWYIDFILALVFFVGTFAVYYDFIEDDNFSQEGTSQMLLAAKSISSSLMSKGYPSNWTNETVIRIGIVDDYSLNATKVKNFKQLNYTFSKKLFGTSYDYFILFVDENGNLINIKNICGVGDELVNITYPIKTAYYYQDAQDDYLLDLMNQTFHADIYFNDANNDIYGLHGFISNITKYGFVVMEHPLMTAGDFNNYKPKIENYTSAGGLFMISGELTTANGRNLIGVDFYKKSGQALSDRQARVNSTDPYLSFEIGQDITFRQAYYVENQTSVNHSIIATFKQDNNVAVARWNFGNGTSYFFSDFDTSYFSGGDFVDAIEDFVKTFMPGECSPPYIENINTTIVDPENFVKIERYVVYNSKITKMVTYVWK